MGKKKIKNNTKKSILKPNSRIFIDELVDAVNKCDKQYGIRLKHPDIWADPRNYREILEAKSEVNIAAMICAINGVAVKDYFVTDEKTGLSTIVKPLGIDEPLFTNASILEWEDKKTKYKTDSLIFRCRYTSLVLSSILGKMDKVTKFEADRKYGYKHSRDERRIVMTKKITNEALLFTRIMMNPKVSYKNIILKMHEHVSYTKKKLNQPKLRELINGHVINCRSMIQPNPIGRRFGDDDMIIYFILKIAYMLATNNENLDPIPKFKYIENATVEHDLVKLIEELGSIIIENSKPRTFSPMFRAFLESRPSIKTQYYKEAKDDYVLRIGILALGYTKFVMNDKYIDKFIDKMLKKGI